MNIQSTELKEYVWGRIITKRSAMLAKGVRLNSGDGKEAHA